MKEKELQEKGCSADFGISSDKLQQLAIKHQQIDEHMVSVGGRLAQAVPIAGEANSRVEEYLAQKDLTCFL